MKRYRKAAALAMAACLSLPGTMGVQAAEPAVSTAESTVSTASAKANKLVLSNGKYYYYDANGKLVKNSLQIVKGKKYYFGATGAAKTGWLTYKGYKYYFGPDGVAKTGWYTIGSKSYYFNTRGIMISKYTKAIDKTLVTKMDQIIKSQGITYKTSDKTALKKLFTYMRDKCGYDRVMNFTGEKGWDAQYAKKMLVGKKGSCYHFAAAYAYLVKRATGLPVRICWGTSNAFNVNHWQPHAWCEVKINGVWYTFDPNVAWAKKNNPDGVRLSSTLCYMQKRTSMVNKVYKRATGATSIQYVNVEL